MLECCCSEIRTSDEIAEIAVAEAMDETPLAPLTLEESATSAPQQVEEATPDIASGTGNCSMVPAASGADVEDQRQPDQRMAGTDIADRLRQFQEEREAEAQRHFADVLLFGWIIMITGMAMFAISTTCRFTLSRIPAVWMVAEFLANLLFPMGWIIMSLCQSVDMDIRLVKRKRASYVGAVFLIFYSASVVVG